MGLNQSKNPKTRGKGPTQPTATQRLYPNLAEEFSTYGRPHTVEFYAPPAYSQDCFGNSTSTWAGQSYPTAPSAPPAIGLLSEAKQENSLLIASTSIIRNGNNCEQDESSLGEKPCPNAKDGCKLRFNSEEMQQHVKACLFMEIVCPLNGVIGNCTWEDKVRNILTHFKDNHRENIGKVNKNFTITGLNTVHLVHLYPNKFLVYIKVDEAKKKILVAVQHILIP